VLQWCLPTGTGAPISSLAAGHDSEPLLVGGVGRERPWRRLEVHLADAVAPRENYHFVIGSGNGGSNPVTDVGSLWRSQLASPMEPTDRAVGCVYICMVPDRPGSVPTAAQREALWLLIQQLRGRYGLSSVALSAELDADPDSRGLVGSGSW